MGEGGSLALSYSTTTVLAVLITIALSFTAYMYGQVGIQASQKAVREEVGREETAILEKLSLLYWDNSGTIWISNYGDIEVKIVKIYVDDQLVWQGSFTINPNEVGRLSIGVKGSVLTVETSSGNIIVLKR